ncbi:MAG: glycine cleavage system protein GcvH [Promethearchaeota archaeon]|jgi:glycine cleavage system H protein
MSYEFPSDLKYTVTHEWVRIEDSVAIAGITDYAQHQLGDIVFVELPNTGMVFEKESNAGEIESVKAVGDFLMPLSGEIIDINKNLSNNPDLVNTHPFGEGWMIKIKISHIEEIADLLSVKDYEDFVGSQEQ